MSFDPQAQEPADHINTDGSSRRRRGGRHNAQEGGDCRPIAVRNSLITDITEARPPAKEPKKKTSASVEAKFSRVHAIKAVYVKSDGEIGKGGKRRPFAANRTRYKRLGISEWRMKQGIAHARRLGVYQRHIELTMCHGELRPMAAEALLPDPGESYTAMPRWAVRWPSRDPDFDDKAFALAVVVRKPPKPMKLDEAAKQLGIRDKDTKRRMMRQAAAFGLIATHKGPHGVNWVGRPNATEADFAKAIEAARGLLPKNHPPKNHPPKSHPPKNRPTQDGRKEGRENVRKAASSSSKKKSPPLPPEGGGEGLHTASSAGERAAGPRSRRSPRARGARRAAPPRRQRYGEDGRLEHSYGLDEKIGGLIITRDHLNIALREARAAVPEIEPDDILAASGLVRCLKGWRNPSIGCITRAITREVVYAKRGRPEQQAGGEAARRDGDHYISTWCVITDTMLSDLEQRYPDAFHKVAGIYRDDQRVHGAFHEIARALGNVGYGATLQDNVEQAFTKRVADIDAEEKADKRERERKFGEEQLHNLERLTHAEAKEKRAKAESEAARSTTLAQKNLRIAERATDAEARDWYLMLAKRNSGWAAHMREEIDLLDWLHGPFDAGAETARAAEPEQQMKASASARGGAGRREAAALEKNAREYAALAANAATEEDRTIYRVMAQTAERLARELAADA